MGLLEGQGAAARGKTGVEVGAKRGEGDAAEALQQRTLGLAEDVVEGRIHGLLDEAAGSVCMAAARASEVSGPGSSAECSST